VLAELEGVVVLDADAVTMVTVTIMNADVVTMVTVTMVTAWSVG